jgi:cytosine/adenosine deaminase-related metal-dependent hydrolase
MDMRSDIAARGAVNAHTHIYSGLAPLGMPSPEPAPETFVQILERVWWCLDQALDEPSLRASARLYVAEALLAGTTTLIDHHESPAFIDGSLDVLAEVCDELGIRALLCYGATERNRGRQEAREGLAECRRFVESNRRPNIRGAVGLHASFTVSDATIREAGELCRELNTILHVHLAEAASDIADAQQRGYDGPLERLTELEALPAGSLLAHGIHLNQDQVLAATRQGLWFLQNPRSNHGNGVGYPAALKASNQVAVGTDGYPSDLDQEAKFLRIISAQEGDDPVAVETRLLGGHRLIEQLFGGAVVADQVERDGPTASQVVVAGRTVVKDGRLVDGDIDKIRDTARRQAPQLWARMRTLAKEA